MTATRKIRLGEQTQGEIPSDQLADGTDTAGFVPVANGDGTQTWGAGAVTDHGALTGLADDDHTQYQKESEKDAASGYAGLSAGSLVSLAELGTGTPDATKFLRGDQAWVTGSSSPGGYSEGTGFPGGPAADDKFLRTDRDLLYFYDGTRWLTVTLFSLPFPNAIVQPTSSTVTYHRAQVPYAGVYDLWLEDFQASFFVSGGTALGASHKWVVTLVKNPAATTIATINIDSGASNAHRNSGQIAIDALVATTEFTFDTLATKTGTPGTLFLNPTVTYRMVG